MASRAPFQFLFAALAVPAASAQAFRPGLEAPGTSGGVYALVAHDDGLGRALYAGGEFDAAGTALAAHVARWRSGVWTALGEGTDGRVGTLLSFDEDGAGPQPARLFAGGDFLRAGLVSARHVARWDGVSWNPLGAGLDGTVAALAAFDDDGPGPRPRALYAAGAFSSAGGLAVNGIARWNGAGWEPLAGGLDGPATSLATYDPDGAGPAREELVVGGFFERASGVQVHGVARWNGLGWSPLGIGVSGSASVSSVQSLASFDPDGIGPQPPRLFVGGSFSNAGGAPANGVASWDGSGFSNLATGVSAGGSFPALRAFTTFDDGSGAKLYATGLVRSVGGVTANADAFDSAPLLSVARWDGGAWTSLGAPSASNTNAIGRALASVDDDGDGIDSLFVGGFFARSGPLGTAGVARWNGASWQPLGTGRGLDAQIHSIAAQPAPGAPVLVGGAFVTAGAQIVNRVALWNDVSAQWNPLGAGVDDVVRAVQVHAGSFWAGGDFRSSAGAPLRHLARFQGSSWVDVGGGTDGPVLALATWQGQLAVGGDFRRAGGLPTGPVALWNGASWIPLPNGPDDAVRALVEFDDGAGPRLWAAGDFTRAGGAGASGVARWNGAQWSAAGGGLCCGSVNDLAVHDDGTGSQLYAGGDFDLDGDGDVDGVARWNPQSQSWTAVGTGFSGGRGTTVRALASWNVGSPAGLVVGGDFGAASGVGARNLAVFRNGAWNPIGTGADDVVNALLAKPAFPSGEGLFVGGAFTVIDGRHSARFARSN
ncbi:MAG: hypothetical protein NTY35_13980 [Planctomycetota bacterium]|nr:hypothetical protein [Planctomycetota bacterium]